MLSLVLRMQIRAKVEEEFAISSFLQPERGDISLSAGVFGANSNRSLVRT